MARITEIFASRINDDMSMDVKDVTGTYHHEDSIDDMLSWIDSSKHNMIVYTSDMIVDSENMIYALNRRGLTYGNVMYNKDKSGNAPVDNVYSTIVTEHGVYYQLSFRLTRSVVQLRDITALYTGWSIADIKDSSGCDDDLEAILAAYNAVYDVTHQRKPKLTMAAQAYDDFMRMYDKYEQECYFPSLPDDVDEFVRKCYSGGLILAPMPKTDASDNYGQRVIDVAVKDGIDYIAESKVNPNVAVKSDDGKISSVYMCMTDHGKAYISDKNSMYPSIMHDKYLPYGNPVRHLVGDSQCAEVDDHIYYITNPDECLDKWRVKYPAITREQAMVNEMSTYYYVRFTASLSLRQGHVPSVKWPRAKELDHTNYITDKTPVTEFYMSEDNMIMMFDDYEVDDYEIVEAYAFYTTDVMFRGYIDKWYDVKAKAKTSHDKLRYKISKLMINGLSGKFAQYDVLYDCSAVVSNGRITIDKMAKQDGERPKHKYVPIAAAITSKGRRELSSLARDNYDILIGGDTDSIITSDMPRGITYGDAMGEYKLEHVCEHSVFLARKTYAYMSDGEWTVKCAGMGAGAKDNVYAAASRYDDMLAGSGYDGLGMLCAFAAGISYSGNIGFDRQPGITRKIDVRFRISQGHAQVYNVVDGEYYEVRDKDDACDRYDDDLPF